MDQTTSKYAGLYLGEAAEGPAPVFRDLSPEGVRHPDGDLEPWPDGAAFAVRFTPDDLPGAPASLREELPQTHFYGPDGWPLRFPTEHKDLPASVRREFQVYPGEWEYWSARAWQWLRRHPDVLARARMQAAVLRPVLRNVPTP